ncbi:MAG: hypothetical protein EOP93_00755 [Lysobacteraceae bacterium]|nr:MAG: hypothetical protein EOP93_00755 [Xanthomonadaceae bacterium]
MTRRAWLARHALGLWFLGIAALGLMRWWMKIGRQAGAAHAPDAMLWLAGSIAMAAIGLVALRRRR